ncbi:MAG TPA: DUF6624 domain-containing protein [Gemmatimonadales bacterium]
MTADWSGVQAELLAMASEDLRLRAELASDGSLFGDYHPRMQAVHDANADRLSVILAERGWPGEPQVGEAGAKAAWLIVQHAIAQPAFQRRALEALRAAEQRGEVPPVQSAMLEDRIRTFEGKPQRYGTQFDWDERGELSPLPVDDPDGVDERRRSVGLPSLAQTAREHRAAAEAGGERPPADWRAYRGRMEQWLREVGWRS